MQWLENMKLLSCEGLGIASLIFCITKEDNIVLLGDTRPSMFKFGKAKVLFSQTSVTPVLGKHTE